MRVRNSKRRLRLIGLNRCLLCLIVCLFLGACAAVSPMQRMQYADSLAHQKGWQVQKILAFPFVLTAFTPQIIAEQTHLTVYIEGDGLAWISDTQPSGDPTPINPLALQLALKDPGVAVYLARPCQFVEALEKRACENEFWTTGRFGPEVIEAENAAISHLKTQYHAQTLTLIGYSGGGAVAALVAAKRNDIVKIITIAGNLDTLTWARLHKVTPLNESLNPADFWQALQYIPQFHFSGNDDRVVPYEVAESYANRFPTLRRPNIIRVPEADHARYWVDNWPVLLKLTCC